MFARTQRLLLRPGFPEDAPALVRAIADQRIAYNVARMPWPYTLADAKDFLSKFADPTTTAFLIFERAAGTSELVGGCGFDRRMDGSDQLGYWIRPDRWGRGYATEASRAVLEVARALGMRHIEAGHFIDNPASGRVIEKLGFSPTGRTMDCFSLGRGRESKVRMYRLALVEDDIVSDLAA